jgi:enoyl-CoA hydratase
MEFSNIIFTVKENVAWIRFNRPKKLNAMNLEVIAEIDKALIECAENDKIKSVVLIGNEKAFIAGADIEPMAKADTKFAFQLAELTMGMQERLADLPKPTIAAISGFALGGGLEVALCCDFRIAAENAVLGCVEIKLGIIPGGGGTQRLPRVVGIGHAAEMLLLGTTVKADKALSIGLVTEVVPLDQLEAKVEELATKLAAIPAMAMKACKTAMRAGLNGGLKEGLRIEEIAFSMLFGTLDQKEGMGAFVEKRKPNYQDK